MGYSAFQKICYRIFFVTGLPFKIISKNFENREPSSQGESAKKSRQVFDSWHEGIQQERPTDPLQELQLRVCHSFNPYR